MFIDGNVYVDGNTYISDETRYVLNEQLYTTPTSKPFIHPQQSIFTDKRILACMYSNDEICHHIIDGNTYERGTFQQVNDINDVLYTINNETPAIRTYQQRFLDVSFDRTFTYYQPKNVELIEPNSLSSNVSELLYRQNDGISIQYQGNLLLSDTTMPNFKYNPTFSFNKTNNHNELVWIVVTGDLTIENHKPTPDLNIDANFLVYGDVYISGSVAMNSIIYTQGEVHINNASIKPYETLDKSTPSQLIMLAKGDIHISKINSFYNQGGENQTKVFKQNGQYEVEPDLTAFLHTEQNFEVYTIGSHLAIKGGIFAQGNTRDPIKHTNDTYGLMINNYRGNVGITIEGGQEQFIFIPPSEISPPNSEELTSRFIIQHSQDILTKQPEGLPINGRFNYIFGDYKITTK